MNTILRHERSISSKYSVFFFADSLNDTVGRISTQYFFVKVRSWNLDIILSNIICQLHAKLNFGIFCYSLRWLENVCKFSSERGISRHHRVKKQKQIDHELANQDDPSSTFQTLLVKFRPNVYVCNFNHIFVLFST